MNGKSLRFQLPFSYFLASFLTSPALGAAVLVGLQLYYAQQERAYLRQSAQLVAENLAQTLSSGLPQEAVRAQLERLARLVGSRVRLLDERRQVVLDSGRSEPSIPTPLSPTPPTPPLRLEPSGRMTTPPLLTPPDLPSPPLFYTDRSVDQGWLARLFRPIEERVEFTISHPETGNLLGFAELISQRSFAGILSSVALVWSVASLLVLLVGTGFGWLLSRRLVGPVLALTQTTQAMAEGNLSARGEVNREDEIGQLAESFNRMAARLEQSVEALRHFLADAAHALNTPLTALRSNLELSLAEGEAVRRQAFLEQAASQVTRLQELITSLLQLARLENDSGAEEPALFDLAELLRDEREFYASQADQKGVSFEMVLAEGGGLVRGWRNQLRQAITSLVDNAFKFTPEGGWVKFVLAREEDALVMTIEDSGMGIPQEDLPYLFERFKRGRNAAPYPGSGLGLAIAKTIAEKHEGTLAAENTESGARFRLRLPAP